MSTRDPLKRSISMANMEKRSQIKEMLMTHIKQRSDETLHYVECGMAGKLNYMLNYRRLEEPFRAFVKKDMVDISMMRHLQETRAINYFRNVKPLYPMNTPGDGNCLLHAVSLAMWSFTDHNAMLRRLVYIALSTENNQFYKRWRQRQKRLDREEANFVPSKEFVKGGRSQQILNRWRYLDSGSCQSSSLDQMWNEVKENASDSNRQSPDQLKYRTLEHIHIFVSSNILRRPIIVVSDTHVHYPSGSVHESAHIFDGIYLPIFWLPEDCVKSPLVLGYGFNHFAPLLGMDHRMIEPYTTQGGSQMRPIDAIPLVKHDLKQRSIHFLLDHEESSSANLLEQYLDLQEIPQTGSDAVDMILCAKIKYNPLSEDLNLIWDHFEELQKRFRLKMEEEALRQTLRQNEPMEVDPNSQDVSNPAAPVELNLNLTEDPKAIETQRKDMERFSMPQEPFPEGWTLMEAKCEERNCNYHASQQTKPYCHEHAKSTSKMAPQESEEKILNLNLSEIEPNMVGEGENSEEDMQPNRCLAGNCQLAPSEKYGGFCVLHKPETQCRIPDCDCKGINTPEKKKKCRKKAPACFEGQCAECFCHEPLVQPFPKCYTEHCTNPGTPRHGGLCSDCVTTHGLTPDDLEILRMLPQRPEVERDHVQRLYKCRVDECFAASTANTLGHCTKHFLLKYKAGLMGIPTIDEIAEFEVNMKRKEASRGLDSLHPPEVKRERKRTPSGQVRERKYLCAVPGCAGVRLKDNELCYQCLRHENYGKPKEPIVLKNYHVPANDDDEEEEPEEAMQQGQQKDDIVESAPPSDAEGTPQQSPTATMKKQKSPKSPKKGGNKCIAPGCFNAGLKTYSGLCVSCYNVLQQRNMAHVELPRPDETIQLQTRREPQPVIFPERQCKKSGCSMYGRREQNGYCSRCYAKQQRGLLLSEESKQALRQNFTTLLDNMQPDEVIDLLYSNSVFTVSQMEEARVTRTTSGKAKYVLQQLLYRGDERAYNVFVQALVNTGQQHLAQVLKVAQEGGPEAAGAAEESARARPTEHIHATRSQRPNYHNKPPTHLAERPKPCISNSCVRYGEGRFQGFCSSCAHRGGLVEQLAAFNLSRTKITGPVRPPSQSEPSRHGSSGSATGSGYPHTGTGSNHGSRGKIGSSGPRGQHETGSSSPRGQHETGSPRLRHRHFEPLPRDTDIGFPSMESEIQEPQSHQSQLVVSGSSFDERQIGLRQKCKYPNCPNYGNPNRSGYCNEGHSVPDN